MPSMRIKQTLEASNLDRWCLADLYQKYKIVFFKIYDEQKCLCISTLFKFQAYMPFFFYWNIFLPSLQYCSIVKW